MARSKAKETVDEEIDPLAPKRNHRCRGHEVAEQAVLDAWSGGRFPHAMLVGGPSGIGKATFAYRVARFVLSGGAALPGQGLNIDPDSGTFRRVASSGHSDIRVLTRGDKTQISVDEARKVIDFAHMTPAESDWRVVIVDKADHLNRNSANALLKILEEPPPRSLFILAADAPGGLLPTIRSRCRSISLKTLSNEATRDLILEYRPTTAPEEAAALAIMSEGSPGRALGYLDAGGLDLFQRLVDIVAAKGANDVLPIYALADRVAGKDAEGAFQALRSLADWWFKRVIGAQARGVSLPPAIDGEDAAFEAIRRSGGLETWIRLWENLTAQLARAEPPRHLDKRQVVIAAFLSLRSSTVSGA